MFVFLSKVLFIDNLLTTCFDGIIDTLNYNSEKPYVGQFFSRVEHLTENEAYYNCTVVDVDTRKLSDGNVYNVVFIHYSDGKGSIFNELKEEIKFMNDSLNGIDSDAENNNINNFDIVYSSNSDESHEDDENEDEYDDDEEYEDYDEDSDDDFEIELVEEKENFISTNVIGLNTRYYRFIK